MVRLRSAMAAVCAGKLVGLEESTATSTGTPPACRTASRLRPAGTKKSSDEPGCGYPLTNGFRRTTIGATFQQRRAKR